MAVRDLAYTGLAMLDVCCWTSEPVFLEIRMKFCSHLLWKRFWAKWRSCEERGKSQK